VIGRKSSFKEETVSCPDGFKNSSGSFFVPGDCTDCKLLQREKTSIRGIDVHFCQSLDARSTIRARLVSVTDGDTIVVELSRKEPVRLLGIDAPEKSPGDHANRQCALLGVDCEILKILAKLSQIHLCGLCRSGSTLTLRTTSKVRDDYSRILAGVFLGDQCLNRAMVEDGYAMIYREQSDWESYSALEETAREAERGIWGACEESFYAATTKSYHRPGCYYAKNAAIRFPTRDDAEAAGLSPCSACLPDYRL
jgi:endonuclease YncB( thermonuclease family)